jgi:hypothetical protein
MRRSLLTKPGIAVGDVVPVTPAGVLLVTGANRKDRRLTGERSSNVRCRGRI